MRELLRFQSCQCIPVEKGRASASYHLGIGLTIHYLHELLTLYKDLTF